MKSKEIKLAYLAGALDGDGSFSLIKGTSHTSVSPLYYPMIQLANTRKELIDILVDEFGGMTGVRKPYVGKDGSQRIASYHWKLEKSIKCLPVLEELIPYLIVKKERASFLRDYIVNNPKCHSQISDSLLIQREKAYLKMRSFNDNAETNCNLFSKAKRKDSDDEFFWAYVAGIMDTDGSFSLKKENRTFGGSISPVYTPTILLTMTDCKAIYYIMNNFSGGNLCVVRAKTATNGFCYRFSITSRKNASIFLEKCIPFLIIKNSVAQELLLFCNTVKLMNGKAGISPEQILFRERFYNAIKELNNGVSKPSLMDLKFLPDNAGDNKAEGESHRERSKREGTLNGDAVL